MSTLPQYSQISIHSLAELSKAKAPASVLLVYTALCSFDYKRSGFCFPKISTIQALLQHSISERKIYWALNWMKEKGFINTQARTSKKRFELVLRKTANWLKRQAKQTCDREQDTERTTTCDESQHKMQRKRTTSYQYRRRGGSRRKSYQNNNRSHYNRNQPPPKKEEPKLTKQEEGIKSFIHRVMRHQVEAKLRNNSYTGHNITVSPPPTELPAPLSTIIDYVTSDKDYNPQCMLFEPYNQVISFAKELAEKSPVAAK